MDWIDTTRSGSSRDADIDLAMMARAQGAEGIGPITSSAELRPATEKAIEAVRNGAVVGLDIRVEPGYDTSMNGSGGRTA